MRALRTSIVTASFNSAGTLAQCIASVAGQSVDVEHILVDGGSTDATQEIIERHRHSLAQAISEPDRGMYDGMNTGVALAGGDIVGILNADDVYASDEVLGWVLSAFEDSEVGACYGDLQYVDCADPGRVVRHW